MSLFKRITHIFSRSDVVDGATAIGHEFDTTNALTTTGANLAQFSQNGTAEFTITKDGGLDAEGGATTAAHSQSLNLNWLSSGTQTSSGQYSVAMGANNTASALQAIAIGQTCAATSARSVCIGYNSTASANNAIIIGNSCTSTAESAVAMGNGNKAQGSYSVVLGKTGLTTNRCTLALGAGGVGDGGTQASTTALYIATTDATQTTMQANGTDLDIPADTTWAFSALIAARSDETDGNLSAVWRIDGCLARDESSSTVIVGSITKTVIADGAGAAWDVTAVAGTTSLDIKVTGEASTNIRWVAKVDISQVTFA